MPFLYLQSLRRCGDKDAERQIVMAKYLFVGDLHDDLHAAEIEIAYAKKMGCSEIIQVGDWGFIWTQGQGAYKLLSESLVKAGIMMRFCDGNHDVHPKLRKFERDKDHNVAPNITYQHRGTVKEFKDGVRMMFLGGAPSIDRKWRTKGISWWPEEEITDEDIEACMAHRGTRIDILVTHDSAVFPAGLKATSDVGFNYRAEFCKEKLLKVLREFRPPLQVHGHYHVRHTARCIDTVVQGLASNLETSAERHLIYDGGADKNVEPQPETAPVGPGNSQGDEPEGDGDRQGGAD